MALENFQLSAKENFHSAHDVLSDIYFCGTIIKSNDITSECAIYKANYEKALYHRIISYNLSGKLGQKIMIKVIIEKTDVRWNKEYHQYFLSIFEKKCFVYNKNVEYKVDQYVENMKNTFLFHSKLLLLIFKCKKITRYIAHIVISILYDNVRKYIICFIRNIEKLFLELLIKNKGSTELIHDYINDILEITHNKY